MGAKMVNNQGERRKYKRAEIRGITKLWDENDHEIFGTIMDISENGAKIFSKNSMDPTKYCNFQFYLHSNYKILGYGKIMHITPIFHPTNGEGYLLGLQFLKLSDNDLAEIKKYVNENPSLN